LAACKHRVIKTESTDTRWRKYRWSIDRPLLRADRS